MRHVSLTCVNHPDLRWSCKEIAWTDKYGYNNQRNIFFFGHKDETVKRYDVEECKCPASDLERAPEDLLSFPLEM